jgi:uncharacterized peroxidase-related enzyme
VASKDERLPDQVAANFETAPITAAEKIMLRYARKLTSHPDQMVREDVAQLRQVGWSDGAILDICQITSYFNYVNRMADGLGVPLED